MESEVEVEFREDGFESESVESEEPGFGESEEPDSDPEEEALMAEGFVVYE